MDRSTVKFILVFGNLIDGFTFRGPFDSKADAIMYAEPIMEEWWLAELVAPELEPTINSGGTA